MGRRACGVVCAFLALSNVLRVDVTADVNPEYTSLSGDVPLIDVRLVTEDETVRYRGRVRREVNSIDKMTANMTEVETTTPPLSSSSSSSHRQTTAVPRQPGGSSHSSSSSIPARLTVTTTATTKKTYSTTPPATVTSSSGASATTMKTTIVKETNHTYYKSRMVTGKEALKYFVSYEDMEQHGRITHQELSSSYRRAFAIIISFKFPFYGHPLDKVTVATGGFLYMSDFLHRWLTATQYIAPLMANFDTSRRNESRIHYADNGTAMIVLWENLLLRDNEEAGPFTFEAILHKDGTIIFSYFQLPIKVSSILDYNHPVKVGLSDAFYIDTHYFQGLPTQRTIYRYHRVVIDTTEITNHTAIIITPLPTCNIYMTCVECLTTVNSFSCMWCPAAGRCSSGFDRNRQDWLDKGCHKVDTKVEQCPSNKPTKQPTTHPSAPPHNPTSDTNTTKHTPTSTPTTTPTHPHTDTPRPQLHGTSEQPLATTPKSQHTTTPRSPPHTDTPLTNTTISSHTDVPHTKTTSPPHKNSSGDIPYSTPHPKTPMSAVAVGPSRRSTRARAAVVLAVILLLCAVCGLVSWLVYAYKNPHSKSGLWLIKHRPSQVRKQLARVRFRKDRQSALSEKYSVSIDTPTSTFA